MTQTKIKFWILELCAQMPAASQSLRIASFSALFLLIFSGISSAQVIMNPPRTPVPPPHSAKPAPTPPVTRTVPRPPSAVRQRRGKRVRNESGFPAEKSISTDTKVNVSLCVSEGNVKINGWDHNEIRAFVSDGSEVGFSIRSKNKQTGKPNWIEIQGFDPQKNTEAGLDECLSGDEIEIDVPRGANIDLKGTVATISVESVNKVIIRNDGGNILLNGIAQGIEATTYQGDVMVENSGGAMKLSSTSGNVVAFETQAGEVGDTFRARTISGAITLQKVEYRQLDAGSNSGSIRFNGDFTSGGQYSFITTNGSINLVVPDELSCRITATYAGAFQSDISLKDIVKTSGSPITLTALAGAGDATLNLRTLGAIRIRKK